MARKIKYNVAYKLRCVKEVLEKHRSVHSVSHQEGISGSLLLSGLLIIAIKEL